MNQQPSGLPHMVTVTHMPILKERFPGQWAYIGKMPPRTKPSHAKSGASTAGPSPGAALRPQASEQAPAPPHQAPSHIVATAIGREDTPSDGRPPSKYCFLRRTTTATPNPMHLQPTPEPQAAPHPAPHSALTTTQTSPPIPEVSVQSIPITS